MPKTTTKPQETLPAAAPKELQAEWVKLTLAQRKFVVAYFENGGNATAAVRTAGYKCKDEASENSTAWELLHSGTISRCIHSLLEHYKITPAYAAMKLYEGLNANLTKFFAHEGMVISEREVIDFGTRAHYLDMLFKTQGAYKGPKLPDGAPAAVIYLPQPFDNGDPVPLPTNGEDAGAATRR